MGPEEARRVRIRFGVWSLIAEKDGLEVREEEREMMIKEPAGTSLEERVVRHLLEFEKLRSVWLGKAVYRL